jgi:hypothetical protein
MKIISKLSIFALLSCSASSYAGAMGAAGGGGDCLSSFFSVEGGYTWNQIKGYRFGVVGSPVNLHSREGFQGATGRLSGGLMHSMTDQFLVSSEIGYGYYGRSTVTPVLAGVVPVPAIPVRLETQHTITGFDALAGVAYVDPEYGFSLFFKAGAMVQNLKTKNTTDLGAFNVAPTDTLNEHTNHTGVLPELKVGGAYYFDTNWGLTLAYQHVFGASPLTTGTLNPITGGLAFSANNQNPSLSTVLAGVQVVI